MIWRLTDEAGGRNVVDQSTGRLHDYVSRSYAADEDEWPRWAITVNHFKQSDGRLVVEVFYRESDPAHGTHANFWPLSLLGPIMATCKWAQDLFKVNLREPSLGTDRTHYLDSPGPFIPKTEAVTRVADEDSDVWTYVFGTDPADDDLVERALDYMASGHGLGGYLFEDSQDIREPLDPEWSMERYIHAAHHAPWDLAPADRDFRYILLDERSEDTLSLNPQITLAILTATRGRRG